MLPNSIKYQFPVFRGLLVEQNDPGSIQELFEWFFSPWAWGGREKIEDQMIWKSSVSVYSGRNQTNLNCAAKDRTGLNKQSGA